ncbi:MAG: FAD-dependent oxidoreductase [Planctomycetaceae bacterium]|nr:FAD-dependent oxidoreductase [Planctomycetaceae bacterium]
MTHQQYFVSIFTGLLLFPLFSVPIFADTVHCDVVVVGGGSAGIVAAVQSARCGAKTILIEAGFQLGGNATTGGVNFPGLFHAWGKQVIAGIGWELVEETVQLNHDLLPDFSVPTGTQHWKHQIRVNLPLYVVLAEELCLKSGVEIRYFESPMEVISLKSSSINSGTDKENWQLITVSQGEKRTIRCKQMIDCTGNGTLCALAGAERMRENTIQPGTFQYSIRSNMDIAKAETQIADIRKHYEEAKKANLIKPEDFRNGIVAVIKGDNSNYVFGADNSTGILRTETNIRGRQSMLRVLRFLQSLPGGENAKLISMSAEVGVRETWRVKGRYVITADDYRSGKVWADSLAYAFYPIDLHINETGVRPAHLKEGVVATIPFRALLPENIDHLLVAGRCISSDRFANSALRVQATCMSSGQVAGAAAALSALKNIAPAELDIATIKATLKEHKAIVPE